MFALTKVVAVLCSDMVSTHTAREPCSGPTKLIEPAQTCPGTAQRAECEYLDQIPLGYTNKWIWTDSLNLALVGTALLRSSEGCVIYVGVFFTTTGVSEFRACVHSIPITRDTFHLLLEALSSG